MAARLNPRHQEMVRQKIKASQLVNALQDHVLEGREMSPTAVQAALGLLKKVIPDTNASSITVTRVTKRVSYAKRLAQEEAAARRVAEGAVEHTVQ